MLEDFLKYLMLPSCLFLVKNEVCQLTGGHLLEGHKVASGLFHAQLVILRRQEM